MVNIWNIFTGLRSELDNAAIQGCKNRIKKTVLFGVKRIHLEKTGFRDEQEHEVQGGKNKKTETVLFGVKTSWYRVEEKQSYWPLREATIRNRVT